MSAPTAVQGSQQAFLPIFPRSNPKLHRKCSCSGGVSKCAACEEEEVESAKGIHRKASSHSEESSFAPSSVLQSLGRVERLILLCANPWKLVSARILAVCEFTTIPNRPRPLAQLTREHSRMEKMLFSIEVNTHHIPLAVNSCLRTNSLTSSSKERLIPW